VLILSLCSVNAASQAITTYIRNHLRRCDEDQDVPLLSRHTLSGTIADDELLPALHSRVGGAHCDQVIATNRFTNFRKGTMVWFLSKAAGGPCPFARAGIRLCDYGPNGKVGQAPAVDPRERRRERDRARRAAQCGEKRKRLARACASQPESDESDLEERRPPKVKLTLRLKPLSTSPPVPSAPSTPPVVYDSDLNSESDSDDDSMSDTSSSDDEELSSPPWTSALNPAHSTLVNSLDGTPISTDTVLEPTSSTAHRRSPSVPYSVASAPPDSEEEDDDFHISMMRSGARRASSSYGSRSRLWLTDDDDEMEDDFDFDDRRHNAETDDETIDTTWGESPSPLSPAPMFADITSVKVESNDITVQGMLDAWEDLDKRVAGSKLVEVVARAAAESPVARTSSIADPFDMWEWEQYGGASPPYWPDDPHEDIATAGLVPVKQEREYSPDILRVGTSISPIVSLAELTLNSPVVERSELRGSTSSATSEATRDASDATKSLLWQDAEILGPDSVHPLEFEESGAEDWKPKTAPTSSAVLAPSVSPSVLAMSGFSWTTAADTTSALANSKILTPSEALAAAESAQRADSKRDSGSSTSTITTHGVTATLWGESVVSFGIYAVPPTLESLALPGLPSIDDIMEGSLESTPLSPTEQEMFQSLCVLPDDPPTVSAAPALEERIEMDMDNIADNEPASPPPAQVEVTPEPEEKPLPRRSTRLARGTPTSVPAPARATTRVTRSAARANR
jgi:hypothetical protein